MEKMLNPVHGGLALLLLTLTPLTAHTQTETNRYTLEESIQIGLKQSITVLNAARGREIAETTRRRALSAAYPTITGSATYDLYDDENFSESGSKTLGAEASWQVFSGGRTLSAIRASKTYRQLTAVQERRIRETQTRDIILAYYQVKPAEPRAGVLEQSVQQLADFEQETRAKYDAGSVSEFDWLSAKVSLANEKPRLIVARNDLAISREHFKNLVFLDSDTFELTDSMEFVPMELELEEAIQTGLVKRPELQEKAGSISLRKEDVNQQKSDLFPSVSVFLNYTFYNPDPYSKFIPGNSTDDWQAHWSAGARASWSLFDGGLRRSNIAESKLNLAIEEDEYRDMARAVSLDIRTQWLRGRDAVEAIEATSENIALATRALEIARARFDEGISTNLEVTQSNLELSNARLARSQALYEYVAAITQLKHAAGMLLEEYEND